LAWKEGREIKEKRRKGEPEKKERGVIALS
jgi:hypothetical protein